MPAIIAFLLPNQPLYTAIIFSANGVAEMPHVLQENLNTVHFSALKYTLVSKITQIINYKTTAINVNFEKNLGQLIKTLSDSQQALLSLFGHLCIEQDIYSNENACCQFFSMASNY